MPLKAYKTKDEIPEAQRADAIELKDGSFGVVEEADTSGLTSSIAAERKRAEAAEGVAKKAADELKKLQTEKKASDAGLSAEQLQKIREDVRADVVKEFEGELASGKVAQAENRSLKLDSKVKALALKHGVRADRIDAWWQLFGGRFDLTADGTESIVKDKAGVKLESYITDTLKKELPDFYEGSKGSGGGAGGDSGAPRGGGGAMTAEALLANPAAALTAARMAGVKE